MTYDGDRIKALLDEGVSDKVYPGAVWAIGDGAGTSAHGTTGVLDPDEPDTPMRRPWVTLLSAVVGAVVATSFAALLDRVRWRRDRHDHPIGVRRALYGDYLECLSQARNAFRSLVRNLEAPASKRQRITRDSFGPCYGMRYQLSITASEAAFEASEVAFRRLRDLRDLVAARTVASDEAYVDGRLVYDDALKQLRAATRQEHEAAATRSEPRHAG